MKRIGLVLILIVLGSIWSSAYGATFRGKVIDADTREPIEGAVVVAVWQEATSTISGASTRLKDVKETLTNKDGEWAIEGPKGRWGSAITAIYTFFTGSYYTRPPEFIVFKPGYCSWPKGFRVDLCQKKLTPSGNDKVANGEPVELPKLTNKRDRLKVLPTPIHKDGDKEFYKKQNIFLKLIDEESTYLGIPEYKILKESESEK